MKVKFINMHRHDGQADVEIECSKFTRIGTAILIDNKVVARWLPKGYGNGQPTPVWSIIDKDTHELVKFANGFSHIIIEGEEPLFTRFHSYYKPNFSVQAEPASQIIDVPGKVIVDDKMVGSLFLNEQGIHGYTLALEMPDQLKLSNLFDAYTVEHSDNADVDLRPKS